MDQLWTDVLRFIEKLVSPDWSALIALLPLALAGFVGLYIVWTLRRFMGAGPTRRGPRRITPAPPSGIHMPGPSYAPIIGSVGVAFLLAGLVFGGVVLAVGVLLLVLALLYWGREAMREYDTSVDVRPAIAAPVHAGPPPGVHMPGPSWRPLLASLALAVLFFGLVFGGALLVVGLLMLVISLLGWLADARHEYRDVEVADAVGHPPPARVPGYPRGTLAVFVVLLIGGLVLQTGLLPPSSAVGGSDGGPDAAASPTPGTPGNGGDPGGGPSVPPSPGEGGPGGGDVEITAFNIAFENTAVNVAAGRPFTIHFLNKDPGIPHNVEIRDGGGTQVYLGEIFPGAADRVYEVPPLGAGTYPFLCTVHPNMTGTLTAQ
jgi:plastocyanin